MDSHSPTTDIAMLLGMAYVLITEDSPQLPLIDWDFLNNYTVGFDTDHMPEGADVRRTKDYVLALMTVFLKLRMFRVCGVSPQNQILCHRICNHQTHGHYLRRLHHP